MKLTEFGSLQLRGQTYLPFSISSSNEHYVVSTKDSVAVLQLRYRHINDDGALNYIVTRFDTSKEKPTGQLDTREVEVYDGSNREERAKIMLDQTFIPNIATLHINNAMAVASPPGIFPDYNSCLVAHLTNMGQLTLHRYDKARNEWNLYVDVSATWIAHFHDNATYVTFKPLEKAVRKALITAFCWREHVMNHVSYFAIGTKAGRIAIYSLLANCVRVEHVAVYENDVRSLKWIAIDNERNLLLVGFLNGKIGLYGFRTVADGSVVDGERLSDVWGDEDNLIIGHMQYEIDYEQERVTLLAVKGTHLIAAKFSFRGEMFSIAFQNLNNFMITGVQQVCSYRYMVSTLPGNIFCATITTTSDNQLHIEYRPVETDVNTSKFSIYGLTTTANRSCWLLVGYPSKSFDHLSLRTPTTIFFCKFNEYDALKLLLVNPTLRMTDYYDCAEVVRFSGNRNLQTLNELEALTAYQPNVDDHYAYNLKLQLLQLGSRLSYFKKRCFTVAEILYNQSQFITMVIEVLHAAKVIYYFRFVRQTGVLLSYAQLLTIRCLRNYIKEFVDDNFPGDFEHVHHALKPTMEEVFEHANEMLASAEQQPLNEECAFCGELILDSKLTCLENHQTFRCSITKQQIEIGDVETVCEMCELGALDLKLLEDIFSADGGQLTVYYRFCCVCDVQFTSRAVV